MDKSRYRAFSSLCTKIVAPLYRGHIESCFFFNYYRGFQKKVISYQYTERMGYLQLEANTITKEVSCVCRNTHRYDKLLLIFSCLCLKVNQK